MRVRLVEVRYQAGCGIPVNIPLTPFGARQFMTHLGLARDKIRKNLVSLFRYGCSRTCMPGHTVQFKPVYESGPNEKAHEQKT